MFENLNEDLASHALLVRGSNAYLTVLAFLMIARLAFHLKESFEIQVEFYGELRKLYFRTALTLAHHSSQFSREHPEAAAGVAEFWQDGIHPWLEEMRLHSEAVGKQIVARTFVMRDAIAKVDEVERKRQAYPEEMRRLVQDHRHGQSAPSRI